MQKKVIILLFAIVPFIGMGQSARKINKVLKLENASALKSYDSILRINDSVSDVYAIAAHVFMQARNGFFKKIDEARNAREEVLSLYRKLELLGITEGMTINFQTLDTIKIPYNIKLLEETASPQNGINKIEKQAFELWLEDLSVKAQNKLLASSISEIRQAIVLVQNMNANLISATPQLESKSNQLLLEGKKLDAFTADLNNKIDYLDQQKQLARSAYASKGPKGFNEHYAWIFPDVFPEISESKNVDAEVVNDGAWVEMSDPPAKYEMPAEKSPEVYVYVDEPAEFPGGIVILKEYLKANLKYPEMALEKGIEGKCYVQFVVSAEGTISDVKVLRGVPDCRECDQEAIRLVEAMPDWIPAKVNGKLVKSKFNLPVAFRLPGN